MINQKILYGIYTREEQRYGRNKSTTISRSLISSGQYRKKFDALSSDQKLNKLLYSLAKKMLLHRTGTLYEDMYWIDIEKHAVVCEVTNSTLESKIEYTEKISRIVECQKGLLTIHSHPNGFPPSIDDFNSAYLHGYSVGVVCGHNGDVFVYQSNEFIPEESYFYLVEDFIKKHFNPQEAQFKTLELLSQRYDIFIRKVGV